MKRWLSFALALLWLAPVHRQAPATRGYYRMPAIRGGVDPDTVVDNLPHATFGGSDAPLAAGIAYLQREIKAHPVPVPATPAYPNKAKP
jgi:hypothetical protein